MLPCFFYFKLLLQFSGNGNVWFQAMSKIVILAVCFKLKQLKKQPEKNSSLDGTRTHDHVNISTVVFDKVYKQLSFVGSVN